MENNIVKIDELKQVSKELNNVTGAHLLEIHQLIAEAIGILRHAEFDKKRVVDIDGALVSILDVERYNTIMNEINAYLNDINNAFFLSSYKSRWDFIIDFFFSLQQWDQLKPKLRWPIKSGTACAIQDLTF